MIERLKGVTPEWLTRRLSIAAFASADLVDGKAEQSDAQEPLEEHESETGWTPFEDLRHDSSLKRADIIFGPDAFDPRTENGADPFRDALVNGELGLDQEELEKTVGELIGEDLGPDELHKAVQERLWPKVRPMSRAKQSKKTA